MTSTRAQARGVWPDVADAGHLLVSALHQDAPGPRLPAVRRGQEGHARRPGGPGTLPPRHKPVDLALLARTLKGLRALPSQRGDDEAAPAAVAELRAADLAVWPLFAGLGPLGALPTAPRLVRTFATLVLRTWGLTAFRDDTELLMSEMATNAVAAATGPEGQPRYDDSGHLHLLWARLLADGERVRLELWDTVPEELGVPVQRQAETTDESGRGLELLDMLSASWGWEPVPGRAAKKVWAELREPSGEAADEGPARTA